MLFKSRSLTSAFGSCRKLVEEKLATAAPDPFLIGSLTQLFGEGWVRSKGIRPISVPIDEPLDRALGRWAEVSTPRTDDVEVRYRALWRVIRAFTRPTLAEQKAQFELREINCSPLNIRPRTVDGGTLCGFRLYYLGRGRLRDEPLVFDGFVFPNVDRLEFLAAPSITTTCSL